MPKIMWFGVGLKDRRFKLKPRGALDIVLLAALGVVVVLLCVLPPQPTLPKTVSPPAPSVSPENRSAAVKPKPTPAPTVTPDKGILITQLVLKDTANAQISVPVIEGMRDEAAQKAFNDLLYRESGAQNLLNMADEHERTPGDTAWEASLQYAAEQIGRVLHITTYAYTFEGGVHGAEARAEFYLDPITGTIFRLSHLFKDPQGALTAIREVITDAIGKHPGDYFPDAGIEPIPSTYRIQQDGIAIYYPPYAIAPYASGFPEFLIPWSVLNPYINHQGVFIKALNDRR